MIGVFGSAFNPPTLGHEDAILQALTFCDKVLLVPSFKHAFNKQMLDFDKRCELVECFIEDKFKHLNVELCDIEKDIFKEKPEPIYTWKLLEKMSCIYPKESVAFLCGSDNFDNFSSFDKSDYIKQNWKVIGLDERKKIRSTMIRDKIKRNQDFSMLTSSSVEKLVKNNGYYK